MPDINNYNYQQAHDRKLAQSICVAANVQVIAFDPVKMTVNVQPISKQLENGKYESQPPILRVPIACTHSGGFIFRPWFKVGDTGTVVYLDHDIDNTVASGKETAPSTERNHSTSDAVFVGAIVSGSYGVKGLPDESIAIATDDAIISIAVLQDEIQILAMNRELDVKTYFFTVNGSTGSLSFTVRNMEEDKETAKFTIDANTGDMKLATRNVKEDKETLGAVISGQSGDIELKTTNVDTDIETIQASIKGQTGLIELTTKNTDTKKETVNASLDGQSGKASLITKNKETGNETAYIKMDGAAKTIDIQGYVTVKGSFTPIPMTIPD